ncbi:MAG: hypothetical protein ACLGXA_03520 [Acidobacteriota bacterium]
MKVDRAVITRRSFLQSLAGLTAATPAVRPFTARGPSLSSVFARAAAAAQHPAARAAGEVEFESSNAKLVAGFTWAKHQALQYVRNGDPVGPWYEAALPGRNAFCMRDVSHMSTGAQLLGLGARTQNMLRQFAAHISVSKKWCSWWEITGDGKPAPVDYNSDRNFWYDLPANFDVLNACYRQWLWSRDDAYIRDPLFLNYYRRTVTNYVVTWDHDRNGLLEHLPDAGHMGIATYDEDLQDQVLVGADLIAAQYAGYRDYAAIERATGASSSATEFAAKAESLKTLYNRRWWNPATQSFYGARGEDGKFHANLKASTGGSDIEFPLYFGLVEPGPKTQACLNLLEGRLHLAEAARTGVIGGVEGVSYLPDIFYAYGRSRAACTVLLALMDPQLKRRTYPEISFTVIGNLGKGLMGIQPAPRSGTVATFPQLTPETSWAALHHVPVGRNVLAVHHQGNAETALKNEAGPSIFWEPAFPGAASAIEVDGGSVPAQSKTGPDGSPWTFCRIEVRPGGTLVTRRRRP